MTSATSAEPAGAARLPNGKAAPSRVVRYHRRLGLIAAFFWLVQAITGTAILFHWELDDAIVSMDRRATDLGAIEARLDALAPPASGREITSFWTTAGLPDRYNITVQEVEGGESTSVRIAGDGTVLAAKPSSESSFLHKIVTVHQKLMLGETGSWIVGISGVLLLTNILLGLRAAWPRPGQWRLALFPPRRGAGAARIHALHRSLGLMLAVPALFFVSAGTILVFQNGLSQILGAEAPSLPPLAPTGKADIGFARAAEAGLRALGASSVTMVGLPKPDDATYQVRALAPGEIRRAYGTSTVFIEAETGRARGIFPAAEAPAGKAFIDALYAVHTGEIFGLAGRLAQLAVALWLAGMIYLGLSLWRARRRPARKQREQQPTGSGEKMGASQ